MSRNKTLKNGSTEIARVERGSSIYVAAHTGGVQPYATWAMDKDGHTYWGHYFETEQQAISDLKERASWVV